MLLLPCQTPKLNGNTNEDLLNWSIDLRTSIDKCNVDKMIIKLLNDKNKPQ